MTTVTQAVASTCATRLRFSKADRARRKARQVYVRLGIRQNPYRCVECRGWHLASSKESARG